MAVRTPAVGFLIEYVRALTSGHLDQEYCITAA